MPFVICTREQDRPENPEALFRTLRPRDTNVRDLLLRQGDVLRAYAALPGDLRDVAVELPTGGGKTLVGLLIAEWRRRALGHRVAYLCPTVQLVNQVAAKAHDYGLDVVTLVRRQREWDPLEFTRFQRAQAIAITGYHQVFNSNPRLDSAQTLVLDDAHAGEDAVASSWSIRAHRGTLLYTALIAAFRQSLPTGIARFVADDNLARRHRTEQALVPPEAMPEATPAILSALDEYATEPDPDAYSRTMIEPAIDRCLAYVSWGEVLIRPFIVPTTLHSAFADAEQRVYMSATLGVAGELERAFGVETIARVSAQRSDDGDWGRRFFLIPYAARQRPDEAIAAAIDAADRAAILTPSNAEADEAAQQLVPAQVPVLRATDVEGDAAAFVAAERAVLLLANRYDGIDLPDQACRLLVLSGLPAHAHPQERFIMDALGARRVLSERIRTRIQQGAGRATRNARDFAAVVIRGDALTDFLSREEELRSLPPQLQAEIDFGFDNAQDATADAVRTLEAFWEQGQEWKPAEDALKTSASHLTRRVLPADTALAASARKEVACWNAVFVDDLARAVDLAQEVTDALIGGDELRPYRALWFYLAASWAWRLAVTDPERWRARAEELQREATGAARTLRWTPVFVTKPEQIEAGTKAAESRASRAAAVVRRLGIRGGRFETHLQETVDMLAVDDASSFEEGLRRLGELLGFEAVRPSGQADPDSAWRDGQDEWLLFEAKTEERADTPLSAESVRQAITHAGWVASELGWEPPARQLTCVVSHKASVDSVAQPIAGDLRLIEPAMLRDTLERTLTALREARATARGLSDDAFAAEIGAAFMRHGLDTGALVSALSARRIADG